MNKSKNQANNLSRRTHRALNPPLDFCDDSHSANAIHFVSDESEARDSDGSHHLSQSELQQITGCIAFFNSIWDRTSGCSLFGRRLVSRPTNRPENSQFIGLD